MGLHGRFRLGFLLQLPYASKAVRAVIFLSWNSGQALWVLKKQSSKISFHMYSYASLLPKQRRQNRPTVTIGKYYHKKPFHGTAFFFFLHKNHLENREEIVSGFASKTQSKALSAVSSAMYCKNIDFFPSFAWHTTSSMLYFNHRKEVKRRWRNLQQ